MDTLSRNFGRTTARRVALSGMLIAAMLALSGCWWLFRGQGNIEGAILDARTMTPVTAGVAIRIGSLRSVVTYDGRYLVREIPAGTHLVEAKSAGYQPYQKEVGISRGSTTRLDILLSPRTEDGKGQVRGVAQMAGAQAASVPLAARSTRTLQSAGPPRRTPNGAEYAPDELLVRFRPGIGVGAIRVLLSALGMDIKRVAYDGETYVVRIPDGALDQAIERLLRLDQVRSAQKNPIVRALGVPERRPNDELYRYPNTFEYQWHYDLIRLPQAWAVVGDSGRIRVAVLDTEIGWHEDLNNNVSHQGVDYAEPDGDPRGPGPDPSDPEAPGDAPQYSHGTHVAGTIGAVTNNGIGVAGVAWNRVEIMPVQVLDKYGSGTLQHLADGIRWAVDHGADIINMSLGGPWDPYIDPLDSAIRYAAARGVVMVAAAGNDNGSVFAPASHPLVIAVGAVTKDLQRASYSNRGPELELMAPGGDWSYPVWSTSFNQHQANAYVGMAGTSMAAPHVTGVIALMMARGIRNPAAIREILRETATDLGAPGRDDDYGYGVVDAYAAVQELNVYSIRAFVTDRPSGPLDGSRRVRSDMVYADGDGAFLITNAEPGEGLAVAWIDRNGNFRIDEGEYYGEREVTVTAGRTVDVGTLLLGPRTGGGIDLEFGSPALGL